MILVTGANGHLGSQTIDFLLDKVSASNIAGLVRSKEKGAQLKEKSVELRIGDYTDYPSIQEAVKNIDQLLLISSSTIKGRVSQHENVIKAAAEADVDHIFYTSMLHADQKLSPMAEDHAQTEQLIKDSQLTYSIFRHTFYTEFLPLFMGNALETGQWAFPSDGNKINLAYRTEMAQALANGLANPDNHENNIYEITSSKAYTLNEIAEMVTEAAGKKITYNDVSVSDFKSTLEEIGLPEEQIAISVLTAQTFVNGALDFTHNDLEKLLGSKPTGVETFIQQFINS